METERSSSTDTIFRLLRDGHRVESLLSGWNFNEDGIARALIDGWRRGEKVDPAWICPPSILENVLQTVREETTLSPVQVSSRFRGRISPTFVRVLQETSGADRGLETSIFSEQDYEPRFDEDLRTARRSVLIVAAEVKGRYWLKYAADLRRIVESEGEAAVFTAEVAESSRLDLESIRCVVIEQKTHVSLVLIDDRILWEGSMNFLHPPRGAEHIRRTISSLQCARLRDLHDLYI